MQPHLLEHVLGAGVCDVGVVLDVLGAADLAEGRGEDARLDHGLLGGRVVQEGVQVDGVGRRQHVVVGGEHGGKRHSLRGERRLRVGHLLRYCLADGVQLRPATNITLQMPPDELHFFLWGIHTVQYHLQGSPEKCSVLMVTLTILTLITRLKICLLKLVLHQLCFNFVETRRF